MSIWVDEVMSQLDEQDMSENQALELYHSLSSRFCWTGTIFTMRDVDVIVHPDNDPDSEGEYADWDEKDSLISWVMRDALQTSWMWDRGIPELLTERGNEMLPTIELFKDGSFQLVDHVDSNIRWYNADGTDRDD